MRIVRDNYWHNSAIHGRGGGRILLRELFDTLVLTLVIFFVVRAIAPSYWVEGESMQPTLETGQRLLVNKAQYFQYDANFLMRLLDPDAPVELRYLFGGPKRGDIVVFEPPAEARAGPRDDFIKRVIAAEGETVEIKADTSFEGNCGECGVYVDGVRLEEPYIKDLPNYSLPPTLVPKGHVFVLGDNRRNSSDSHIWGTLSLDRVVGTAFVSYWPQDHFAFFANPSYAGVGK